MPVFQLSDELLFPDPALAEPDGLLAIGGDLSPQRLLLAYASGIFPWYSEGRPILWWAPDPRFVLCPTDLHVGRTLRKSVKRRGYRVTLDSAFARVVLACADAPRADQDGTWITADMRAAYERLHELGFAHSVETWDGDELVGGIYGVSLGSAFFGESMFARADDASKVAFVRLVDQLRSWGFTLVDCQVETEHLERFGAVHVPLDRFRQDLEVALEAETRRGTWVFDHED
jgi:leucyl/phenylalanyl-tRNA--protein transferase